MTITDTRKWALENSAAYSVLGRASSTAGRPDDIVAPLEDRVLARTVLGIGFSQVSTDMIAANAVTVAKMAANSVDSDQYVDGSIDTIHVANDAIDDTKVGNRVPQIYRRQGGSATVWATAGTTTYTPTTVRIQCGVATIGAGGDNVVFPEAFSFAPVVVATFADYQTRFVVVDAIIATQFAAYVLDDDGSASTGDINWIAIGPE
jgi:hypothetical protein